jgi:hypothetical protein
MTTALARYQTSEKGDEATIGPGEAGRSDLPAKQGQLVAEHEDLGILRSCVHAADAEPFCDTPDELMNIGESRCAELVPADQAGSGGFGPFRRAAGTSGHVSGPALMAYIGVTTRGVRAADLLHKVPGQPGSSPTAATQTWHNCTVRWGPRSAS